MNVDSILFSKFYFSLKLNPMKNKCALGSHVILCTSDTTLVRKIRWFGMSRNFAYALETMNSLFFIVCNMCTHPSRNLHVKCEVLIILALITFNALQQLLCHKKKHKIMSIIKL